MEAVAMVVISNTLTFLDPHRKQDWCWGTVSKRKANTKKERVNVVINPR